MGWLIGGIESHLNGDVQFIIDILVLKHRKYLRKDDVT